MKKVLLGLLCLGILLGTSACSSNVETEKKTKDEKLGIYEKELTAGSYIIGIDIPAGTYNFVALKNKGTLDTGEGGLYISLNVETEEDSSKDFKNAELIDNTTLIISGGLKVKITSQNKVNLNNANQRKAEEKASYKLKNGNFKANKDFDPGVYVIKAISGGGEVSASNSDFYEYMISPKADPYDLDLLYTTDNYSNSYQFIEFDNDTILTVQGLAIELYKVK